MEFIMCQICTDWIKGSLTSQEAWRNLRELRLKGDMTEEEMDHVQHMVEMLSEPESD